MEKDKRYKTVRHLIEGGHMRSFGEFFDVIPKSVVARDMGINNMRFTRLIKNPGGFYLRDVRQMARLFEIDIMIMLRYLVGEIGKK